MPRHRDWRWGLARTRMDDAAVSTRRTKAPEAELRADVVTVLASDFSACQAECVLLPQRATISGNTESVTSVPHACVRRASMLPLLINVCVRGHKSKITADTQSTPVGVISLQGTNYPADLSESRTHVCAQWDPASQWDGCKKNTDSTYLLSPTCWCFAALTQ